MKKDQMIAARLPQEMIRDLELIEHLEQTDRSTTVRKLLLRAIGEWKRDFYARRYGEGGMSLARAAEEAGVSLWEMMDYVGQKKITAQYDRDDLIHDRQVILDGEAAGPEAAKPSSGRGQKERIWPLTD